MPNLNPNRTGYFHSYEPNTNDLTLAMDYDPNGRPVLRIDDTSLQHTSKDRAKISNYEITFFNTFQYDKETDIWDEVVTAGATSVHNTARREVDLSVNGAVAGAKVTRQTRNIQRYIPGRTAEATFSCVIGEGAAGIRKRIGVFDDRNGLFLEQIGDELAFVERSDVSGSVVDIRTIQTDWNQNQLLGAGNLATVLDVTKRQMIQFEYEWYGAGIAELKFIIDDHPISVHKTFHANRVADPYMATPFLPFRVEIENVSATSGTSTFKQSSCSYSLEGDASKNGIAVNINSPITGTILAAANSWYPVLSIRLNPTRLAGIVIPTFFQVATTDNTNVFYRVVRNAVIGTGGSAWASVPDGGVTYTQYQTYTTPSAIAEIDQGSRVDAGFVIAGGGGVGRNLEKEASVQLGRNTTTTIGDTSDVFTILCASNNTNKSALASISWIEQR